MKLKTTTQRSAFHSILWTFLTWVAASLPEWAGMFDLPEPWDSIVPMLAAFLAGVLRLLVSMGLEPSVSAVTMDGLTVATLPPADRDRVHLARKAR
jgi:hypothetical protein